MQPAKRRSLYERLLDLPEELTGEVIGGQIHTQPRPAGPHAVAASRLGADIEGPYGRGRGGPGGWWIIDEPEVHFVRWIYARVLMEAIPLLPVGEEGRLGDPVKRLGQLVAQAGTLPIDELADPSERADVAQSTLMKRWSREGRISITGWIKTTKNGYGVVIELGLSQTVQQ